MRRLLGSMGADLLVIYMIDNPGVLLTIVSGLLLAGIVLTFRKGNDKK